MTAWASEFVVPSDRSTAAFLAIVTLVCASVVFAAKPTHRGRTAAVILGWLAATAAISWSGWLATDMLPPPLFMFFIGCLIFAVAAACSPFGRQIAERVPVGVLIGFQGFRLPLEIVLHDWFEQGSLPIQMTFLGHNFDIVTGILALLVLAKWRLGSVPRFVAVAFNVIGASLLAAVSTIAVLSSPVPVRVYDGEPAVLLALHFPYGWIVPFCIGGALFGHIVLLRRLRSDRH